MRPEGGREHICASARSGPSTGRCNKLPAPWAAQRARRDTVGTQDAHSAQSVQTVRAIRASGSIRKVGARKTVGAVECLCDAQVATRGGGAGEGETQQTQGEATGDRNKRRATDAQRPTGALRPTGPQRARWQDEGESSGAGDSGASSTEE